MFHFCEALLRSQAAVTIPVPFRPSARIQAFCGVAGRRERPARAVRRHVEDRGGVAIGLVPLLDGRGAAVHDHRVARRDVGREGVLVAGVEHRRVAVVAPHGDAVLPDAAVRGGERLVAVGAAGGGVRARAGGAAATHAVAELSDGVGVVLAEGAVAERVHVRGAGLTGAEAAGDDARGARGEAGAVAVVGDRGRDGGLAEVGQRAGVEDVAEERPLLHRVVDAIDAPTDGGVVRVEPERDVDAGGVDVGHDAGGDALHALGAGRDAAVLPGRAEADAAGEGVVVAVLVCLDERVVGREGALDQVGDRLAAGRSVVMRPLTDDRPLIGD